MTLGYFHDEAKFALDLIRISKSRNANQRARARNILGFVQKTHEGIFQKCHHKLLQKNKELEKWWEMGRISSMS